MRENEEYKYIRLLLAEKVDVIRNQLKTSNDLIAHMDKFLRLRGKNIIIYNNDYYYIYLQNICNYYLIFYNN